MFLKRVISKDDVVQYWKYLHNTLISSEFSNETQHVSYRLHLNYKFDVIGEYFREISLQTDLEIV